MRKLRTSELNRLSPEEFRQAPKHPCHLYLDNIRSLLNVGSIFRTADAFRCAKIWLGGVTPSPQPEMRKTALGATEAVAWQAVSAREEAKRMENFRQEGFQIWALEQTDQAVPLQDWRPDLEAPTLIILGNEVNGVSPELLRHCQGAVEIPQYGTKHSFNVSVSTGILLWEYIRRLA